MVVFWLATHQKRNHMFDGCVRGTVGLRCLIVNLEREGQMLSEHCDLGLQRAEGITAPHSTRIFSPLNLFSYSPSYLYLYLKFSLNCLLSFFFPFSLLLLPFWSVLLAQQIMVLCIAVLSYCLHLTFILYLLQCFRWNSSIIHSLITRGMYTVAVHVNKDCAECYRNV